MKAHDYLHRYAGYHGALAECRVRVFAQPPGGLDVAILTELPTNPGTSVTNMIQDLTLQVGRQHAPDRVSDGVQPLVFVEHYPADRRGWLECRYALVRFASWSARVTYLGGRDRVLYAGPPSWTHLDRATVEELVGQALTDDVDTPLAELRPARYEPNLFRRLRR